MPIKKIYIFCLLSLLLQSKYSYQSETLTPFKWELGEQLIYHVKWTFIKLGELKLQVVQKDTLHSRPVYYCRIKVDSSPGLFIINLHDIYESYIDAEEYYSHLFRSYENKGDYVLFTEFDYNPDSQFVKICMEKQRKDGNEIILDTMLAVSTKIQDSLSLLYFARAMAKSEIQTALTVLIYTKFEWTHLKIAGKPEIIDWHDANISAYPLNGQLKFVGLAGVKEDYSGWFSADSQSVPLRASMKAIVGSVRIELKEWRNWKSIK
jgi:hypothetical protein